MKIGRRFCECAKSAKNGNDSIGTNMEWLLILLAIPVLIAVAAAIVWFCIKVFWVIFIIVFKFMMIALAIAAVFGLFVLIT